MAQNACIVRTTSARDLSPVILTGPTPDDLFFPMSTCANLTQHAWARCIMADLHNAYARRVISHLTLHNSFATKARCQNNQLNLEDGLEVKGDSAKGLPC